MSMLCIFLNQRSYPKIQISKSLNLNILNNGKYLKIFLIYKDISKYFIKKYIQNVPDFPTY